MTDALCKHCGSEYDGRGPGNLERDTELEKFAAYADACPVDTWGAPVSPTWQGAFRGRS